MTDSQTQQIELSSDISTNDNVTSTKKVTGTAPDVVLLCEGERISCHRAVLAKASSYFSVMFSSSFAEKDKKLITIKVHIKTFLCLIFSSILLIPFHLGCRWFYTSYTCRSVLWSSIGTGK
jgi:hypothetical protein